MHEILVTWLAGEAVGVGEDVSGVYGPVPRTIRTRMVISTPASPDDFVYDSFGLLVCSCEGHQ